MGWKGIPVAEAVPWCFRLSGLRVMSAAILGLAGFWRRVEEAPGDCILLALYKHRFGHEDQLKPVCKNVSADADLALSPFPGNNLGI